MTILRSCALLALLVLPAFGQMTAARRMLPVVPQQGEVQRDAAAEKRVLERREKIAAVLPAEAKKKLDALAQTVMEQLSKGTMQNDPDRLARLQINPRFPGLTAEQSDVLSFYVLAEVARLVPLQKKAPDDVDAVNEMSETTGLRLQTLMDRRSKVMTALSNILSKIEKTQDGVVQNLK